VAGMIRRLTLQLVLPLAVLVVWGAVAGAGLVTPYLLPAPWDVAVRVYQDTISGELPYALGLTLARMAIGFVIAAVVGVAIGVLMARIRLVRWFFDPVVSVALPMPKIAFLPIFLLWFGVYDTSKLVLIVVSCIFPVVVATEAATAGVEREMVWSARSLGVGRARLMWDVVLPASLPEIFTGLQVALPIALIVAVVAEMQMGGEGLGADLMQTTRYADTEGAYAGLVAIGLAGAVLGRAMSLARTHLLRWKPTA
jgi:ABC-type nitrate/sulfonate/bicarbonate transport system permease component